MIKVASKRTIPLRVNTMAAATSSAAQNFTVIPE
jgi:hypothetical protein